MSADPTFGLTPGVEILREGQRWSTCSKCKESTLAGQVKDVYGRLNWRTWDALPVEHNGQRYYRRHNCPARQR